MPEPRIQYAKTEDGVNIAYWTMGEGKPLVNMPPSPLAGGSTAMTTSGGRRYYEGLAGRRMVIRYDTRGFGNSQRQIEEFGPDAPLLDLEAVVDHLGLDRFDLMAPRLAAPTAITFAVRHPERTSHLVLWSAAARASDMVSRVPRTEAMEVLRRADWEFYTDVTALSLYGWKEAQQAERWAARVRENVTPETMEAVLRPARFLVSSSRIERGRQYM